MKHPFLRKSLALLTAFTLALSLTVSVFAEGGGTIHSTDNPIAGNGTGTDTGRYPGLYNIGNWGDVERCNTANVYMNAEDTLYFGYGKIADPYPDDAYYQAGEPLTGSILDESGTSVYDFSINPTAGTSVPAGLIMTYEEEIAGPSALNAGGYNALSYTAAADGIYQVVTNERAVICDLYDWTVADSNGKEKPGRVFLYSWSGRASTMTHDPLYILTPDGFIYTIDMGGSDPWMYTFFSNKLGYVDADGNPTYRSWNNKEEGYKVQVSKDNPLNPIFFSRPAEEAIEALGFPTAPVVPTQVENLKFTPAEGDDATMGGTFTFDSPADGVDYNIEIDLREFKLGYPDNGHANGGVVVLSGTAEQGANKVTWDGRDKYGNYVTLQGNVNEYPYTLKVKAGEVHFPLMDVEFAREGYKLELINAPSDYKGSRTKIYYDNSFLGENDNKDTRPAGYFGPAVDGGYPFEGKNNLYDGYELLYGAPVDASIDGVDTANSGALVFGLKKVTDSSGKEVYSQEGDEVAIDFWNFVTNDEKGQFMIESHVLEGRVENGAFEEDITVAHDQTDGLTGTIKADDNYDLPANITVSMRGDSGKYVTLTQDEDYKYYPDTGEVEVLVSSKGDILVEAVCTPQEHDVYGSADGGSITNKNGDPVGEDTAVYGEDYEALLTPDDGKHLPDKITVKVGGITLDPDDYEYDPKTGEINIPGNLITGDVIIAAVCPGDEYTADGEVENGTFDGPDTPVHGEDYVATVAPDDGYKTPDKITVSVDDNELDPSEYIYEPATGKVTIPGDKIIGNIRIKAVCDPIGDHDLIVKATVENGSYDGKNTAVKGTDYDGMIIPAEGYRLPGTIALTIRGRSIDSSSVYDPDTGKISIKGGIITGDIEIVAVCLPEEYTADGEVENGTFDGPDTPVYGEDYVATVAPDDGYKTPDQITVSVGGNELNPAAYDYNPLTGEVTIPGDLIVGDILIKAACPPLGPDEYKASADVTGGDAEGKNVAENGKDYEAKIIPDPDHKLPDSGDVTVTVGGQTLDSAEYGYDPRTGKVTIPGKLIDGDIQITAICPKNDGKYDVADNIRNGDFAGSNTAEEGVPYEAMIVPQTGYKLPRSIDVIVNGQPLNSRDYDYNPNTGEIMIPGEKIIGDVEIIAVCPHKNSGGGSSDDTPNQYKVTFDTNGGTPVSPVRGEKGDIIKLTQITNKDDFIFDGWYLDPELTQPVTSVKLLENITVYAKWVAKEDGEISWCKDDHFAYIIGYTDGMVKPLDNISRAEVTTIFFRLLTDSSRANFWKTTNSFSDVTSEDWCNNAISTMANAGFIKGYGDGTFHPSADITRAEFAVIAARANGGSGAGSNVFADCKGHWADGYISEAVSMGLIVGYQDGTFRPDQPITRAEAITIVNRFLGRDLLDDDSLIDGMIQWPDNNKNDWYYLAIQEATNSHDFTRREGNIEDWTSIETPRDWAALETQWSTAYSG